MNFLKVIVNIHDLSFKGHGVGKTREGLTVFVAGGWPGDELEVELFKQNKKYAHGKILDFITKSTERLPSPCDYHRDDASGCGGCAWLGIDYVHQVKRKIELVEQTLLKADYPTDTLSHLLKINPSEPHFNYRNRAQVKTNGDKMGFICRGTHELIDIKDCKVLNQTCNDQLNYLRTQLPKPEWKPQKKYHKWSIINLDDQLSQEDLYPDNHVVFRQGNSQQNSFMQRWVTSVLDQNLTSEDHVTELFAGSGNFSKLFVEYAAASFNFVEVDKNAVHTLKQKFNTKARIQCLNLYNKKAVENYFQAEKNCDVLFLDPPRSGFPLLESWAMNYKNLRVVIYVSCDLQTFSRDTQKLLQQGFEPLDLQVVDMFPHTPHVEILSVFKKIQ